MDAPISLAERNRINAENRAKYEAAQQQAAADKLARKAANRAAQLDRQARTPESSCGNVEQTGNPRKGCDCGACTHRRHVKTEQQRARRTTKDAHSGLPVTKEAEPATLNREVITTVGIAARTAKILANSCGHVEATGVPRAGCACRKCATRREARRLKKVKRKQLTTKEHDQLLADQGGKCAICGATEPASTTWHVDHDHKTGRIRGLLCLHCNVGLGHFKDSETNLIAAAKYLEDK